MYSAGFQPRWSQILSTCIFKLKPGASLLICIYLMEFLNINYLYGLIGGSPKFIWNCQREKFVDTRFIV